jgi:site-specific recombinase XerD
MIEINVMTALTTGTDLPRIIPVDADKHARCRLGQFERWLNAQGLAWYAPDLASYRDAMLTDGKSPSTVRAHLSTVRARYEAILRDNATRDALYSIAGARIAEMGQADTPSNRKVFVDELITRLQDATNPKESQVTVSVFQDRADSEHLRLTSDQASALMSSPGVDTLAGLRNTAVIALLLCTGVRERKLSNLNVKDLRQRLGGELALHVREGKGCKSRLVPYGALSWVRAIVDKWLDQAGITEGAVFRGLYRSGKLRPGRLSVRAIEDILSKYPVMVAGELKHARPHDLRRTYARRLCEAGVDLVAIQQNLGHADVKTTLGYIGTLDAEKRRAPGVYSFDLTVLQ